MVRFKPYVWLRLSTIPFLIIYLDFTISLDCKTHDFASMRAFLGVHCVPIRLSSYGSVLELFEFFEHYGLPSTPFLSSFWILSRSTLPTLPVHLFVPRNSGFCLAPTSYYVLTSSWFKPRTTPLIAICTSGASFYPSSLDADKIPFKSYFISSVWFPIVQFFPSHYIKSNLCFAVTSIRVSRIIWCIRSLLSLAKWFLPLVSNSFGLSPCWHFYDCHNFISRRIFYTSMFGISPFLILLSLQTIPCGSLRFLLHHFTDHSGIFNENYVLLIPPFVSLACCTVCLSLRTVSNWMFSL